MLLPRAAGVTRIAADARLAGLIVVLMSLRMAAYALVSGGLRQMPARMCQWDCGWYMSLAQSGYDAAPHVAPGIYGQANWAFFPLFPLLVRGIARVFSVPVVNGGFIVANVSFALFVFLAAKYLARVRPEHCQAALVLFLFAVPSSFYFSLPYTEATYAALAMATLYFSVNGALPAASIATALLSATRVTGVLFVPVIAVQFARRLWRRWHAGDHAGAASEALPALFWVALAPLGLFVFMAYLYLHMGDALAFAHVQVAWQRGHDFPLFLLLGNLADRDFRYLTSHVEQSSVVSEYCALMGLAMCAYLWRLRRYAEGWFLLMSILLAAATGLQSMQRYVWANPVFLVFCYDFLRRVAPRWSMAALLVAGAALQLWFVHLWGEQYAAFM